MARSPVEERSPLTRRRLLGLDRSGPAPPETLPGKPLRPWTVPNVIGFARLALIPVFVVVALESGDGRSTAAAWLFAVVCGADYLDGLTARITGQYSRLGSLLDPIIDRLIVVAGMAVCWRFDILPRWAIAVLIARELLMLAAGRAWVRRGLPLRINWPGRLAVWPVMVSPFLAFLGAREAGAVCLYVGLGLTLLATALYVRAGVRSLRAGA